MKKNTRITGIALFIAIFTICTTFITNAETIPSVQSQATLKVDKATMVKSEAVSDNTYENGWKWQFDITLPEDETALSMKFSDWSDDTHTIPAIKNVRYFSAQSENAFDENSSIVINATSSYDDILFLKTTSSVDLDQNATGTQISVIVEMKVPSGTVAGNYHSNYSLMTNKNPHITTLFPSSEISIPLASPWFINWDSSFYDPTDIVQVELWDSRSDCTQGDTSCTRGHETLSLTKNQDTSIMWQTNLGPDANYYGSTTEKVYRIKTSISHTGSSGKVRSSESWGNYFSIIQNAPKISSVEPKDAKSGDTITLFGEGFAVNNTVHTECKINSSIVISTSTPNVTSEDGTIIHFTVPKYTTESTATPESLSCFITISNTSGTSDQTIDGVFNLSIDPIVQI